MEEQERKEDPRITPLVKQFNDVLEAREEAALSEIGRELALLAKTPDRSELEKIHGDKPETPEGPIVSRHQPSDPLYRRLHTTFPAIAEWRTPDQDQWNAEWLRAFVRGDTTGMKYASAKSDQAAGIRATTLGEGLNATSDTAITTGSGGHVLPQSMANVVSIARDAAAVIAPLCTNFTTSGLTLRVPTAGAITADTVAEQASGAQAEPTFASEMLILHKIGARCIASDEMLEDSAFNLMGIYAQRAGEGIGTCEDLQICTTAGTAPDLTEAIAGGNVDELSTTEVYYGDLVTLFFALGKAYQPSATWLAGTVVLTLLSQMTDSNGQPTLKLPSQAATVVSDVPGAIGTIFGRPVYHVPLADGTLIFGDIRGYGFVRKGGIVAKMDTSVGFATDTVQFKFTERVDGRIIDDVAMKQMAALATVN